MFYIITPVTYWILILLWSFILYFYVKKMWSSKTQRLFSVLVLILAIDAFRTLFESVYFGLWNTSLSGLISPEIGTLLTRPELVIIPKFINVIAAVVVIMLLLRKWLPQEEKEQERAAEVLRESENRYFSLFAHNHSVMLLIDSEDGSIVDANLAACDYYGYSIDQLTGMQIHEINILSYDEVLQEMAKGKPEKRNCFQFQHKLASGEIRDVEVYSGPIILDGKQLLYSIIHDVTERKTALQALETSSLQYRGILQSTMEGFWVVNRDGMIVDVNNTLCEMLGYTRDQLLTMSVADVEVEENDEDLRQHIEKIVTTGYDRFESRHRRKDGVAFDVEVSTTYIPKPNEYFIAFIRDITERKRADENLRESEHKHRTLFESMVQGVVYQDRTGTIISANPAAERILGLTLDQMVGRTSIDPRWKTIDEDGFDFPGDTHPTMVSLKSGKPVKNVTIGVFNPQNENHNWINVNAIPCFKPGESVPYQVFTTFEDITERKKAEREKENLENRLNQAQKMEAIGTLAGGIAHDFNNILAAILGYTEMARDDSPPESTIVKDLDKVLEGGNRAKDLVQQILAFSRQNEVEKTSLQPASVVKEAIKMLRPSLPTTIEIDQDITSVTGQILADPTQIHQILMNLCTNAFHAMEETGGKLDISLKEVHFSAEDLVHEPDVEAGTFVQLSISDSGPGIPPDIKKKIFDPYFTTKETGKGTGMGLAIVHGIVKSYGGILTLYSELGEGTAFHVFLPVIEKESLPEIEDVEPTPVGRERILFIDDEEILAEMGKSMLERLGYHVTVRNKSIEALETFKNQPDLFDLVITDQTMPGMTGADIARRMIQIRPDIPIILCTGYSTVISEEKAKSFGIKEYALKPLSKKDIAVLIRKVLDSS